VRLAGRDLLWERVAVSRRPAFEDIRDKNVGARQSDPAEQLVEELACLPHERDTLLILVEAWGLADEHEIRIRAPRAEHDLSAPLRERAARAGRGVLRVRSKCGGALDGVHRKASLRRRADGHSAAVVSGRSRMSRRSIRRRGRTDR